MVEYYCADRQMPDFLTRSCAPKARGQQAVAREWAVLASSNFLQGQQLDFAVTSLSSLYIAVSSDPLIRCDIL